MRERNEKEEDVKDEGVKIERKNWKKGEIEMKLKEKLVFKKLKMMGGLKEIGSSKNIEKWEKSRKRMNNGEIESIEINEGKEDKVDIDIVEGEREKIDKRRIEGEEIVNGDEKEKEEKVKKKIDIVIDVGKK